MRVAAHIVTGPSIVSRCAFEIKQNSLQFSNVFALGIDNLLNLIEEGYPFVGISQSLWLSLWLSDHQDTTYLLPLLLARAIIQRQHEPLRLLQSALIVDKA